MFDLIIALNKISNEALDRAEADILAAQQIVKGLGGEDEQLTEGATDSSDTKQNLLLV